jgi:hypothetical protein
MATPDRPPAATAAERERVEIAAASHPMHDENAGAGNKSRVLVSARSEATAAAAGVFLSR